MPIQNPKKPNTSGTQELEVTKRNKPLLILGAIALIIVGAIAFLELQKSSGGAKGNIDQQVVLPATSTIEEKAKMYDTAKEIVAPAGFINTGGEEIKIQDYIGKKVILVDFWTYSCINCQRTLPYLTSWYEKYRDSGLEMVGIHSPEFEFEKDQENVQKAVEKWGVEYPVVLDNDFGTWKNYQNRYWPHKYLIDIDGFIVYDHIGEGAYDETERKIQELLVERMEKLGQAGQVSTDISTPEGVEEVDYVRQRSPEVYFGALRNELMGNGLKLKVGEQDLSTPENTLQNMFYLDGRWNITEEFITNLEPRAKITFKYQGEKVFMVARADSDVTLTILLDGKPISEQAGSDVKNSQVIVSQDGLYRLVEDPNGWGEHTLEIIIENPGLEAFTFTFG